MKCPKCHHDNAARAKFCEQCATPLARVCGNCGSAVSATAKFCSDCGHLVAPGPNDRSPRPPKSYTPRYLADQILTARATLEGERKLVTVVFADIAGSMQLLTGRDPEDAHKLLDPAVEAQQLRLSLEAVIKLLIRQSQNQPLLVAFDDLQSHDSVTQSLLDGLVETLPRARILLVVSYRPEYQHGWAGKRYYKQLRLEPLPDESVHAMLAALLGSDGQLLGLKQLLIAWTERNPFFIEESARTLVE